MPAATLAFISKHYFNTMFEHEVFRIISTLNAGSLCLRHVNMATRIHDQCDHIQYIFGKISTILIEI